jgi:hypothetical protein
MPGRQVLRYAIAMGDREHGDADPYALADDAFTPLLVGTARGGGDRGPKCSELSVSGAEVSAVVREGDQLVVRVFNPTAEPTSVCIDGRCGWLVDLRGRALAPFEGTFELGPWQIATAQLADG